MAFAIGNPLGLQETVTRGIISAKSRVVDDSSMQYFQTDAAINQGNSGGPLVNLKGEVIGINTRIASQSGGSQGLGFAIPSNVARRTMESIIKLGHVVHGYLGVVIQQLTPELAAQIGTSGTGGALVTKVIGNSPAEKAGIRTGDIITKFNGTDIRSMKDLRARVADTPLNSKVVVGIVRSNEEKSTTAEIVEQPPDTSEAQSPLPASTPPAPPSPKRDNGGFLSGVTVAAIPNDRRRELPENVKGVVVTRVEPDCPAARSPDPLQPGDVIEEINHKPVLSATDFETIKKEFRPEEKQALLFICRGRTRSFLVLTNR